MTKEAADKAEHTEIKSLAQGIIAAQEAEINQLEEWRKAWSK